MRGANLSWVELVDLLAGAIAVKYQLQPKSVTIRFTDQDAEPMTITLKEIVSCPKFVHPPIDSSEPPPLTPSAHRGEDDETVVIKNSNASEFEPTDFQAMLFEALEYHAYHSEDLAAKVGCDRRTLWKKNGIKELVSVGWVAIDKSDLQLGYYRPDAPPKELRRKPEKS